MKTIVLRVILGCIFLLGNNSLLLALEGSGDGVRKEFSNTRIPLPPEGCEIVIYGPINASNLQGKLTSAGSWKALLQLNGVEFSSGGYAMYENSIKALVVAATPEEHKKINILLSP